MSIRRHIPNLISLANATSGAVGIYLACSFSLTAGVWCMIASIVLDFFDGFAARKLGAFSPLGVDLDSLADCISFGVLPATLMCMGLSSIHSPVPFIAFLIVPASVYRLAKFNHDDRQHKSFIGLPTPANALFWAGMSVFISRHADTLMPLPRMLEYKAQAVFPILIILFCWLLLSEVPMFSLKSLGRGVRGNVSLVIVALSTLIGVVLWQFAGLAVGMGMYVLVNLIPYLAKKVR